MIFTYHDLHPLREGHVAIWTVNNGIMIGRVNLSAETMQLMPAPSLTLGAAGTQYLASLPVPEVTLNGQTLSLSTFESGLTTGAGAPSRSANWCVNAPQRQGRVSTPA